MGVAASRRSTVSAGLLLLCVLCVCLLLCVRIVTSGPLACRCARPLSSGYHRRVANALDNTMLKVASVSKLTVALGKVAALGFGFA